MTAIVLLRRVIHWLYRTVVPRRVIFLTAGIGLVAVTLLTVTGEELYDAVDEGDGIAGLDRPVLDQALAWRHPALDTALTAFTHLGGPVGMSIIASLIIIAMTWRWRRRTPLVIMVLGVGGALALTVVGKNLVNRARPPVIDAVPPFETSPSFPSGHALNSTVIAGLIAYLIAQHLVTRLARVLTAVAAGVWAVAMGLSRVFLGHHWLTDVMFGWLVGLAWLAVMITSHRVYLSTRSRRR